MSQILCKAENQDKSGNVGKEIGKGEITSGCIKGGSADVQGGHYWTLDISLWMKPIAYSFNDLQKKSRNIPTKFAGITNLGDFTNTDN